MTQGGENQDRPAPETDTPGIVVIPPLVYGAFLAAGVLVDYLFPLAVLPNALQYAVGLPMMVVSFLIALPAMMSFRKVGTQFDVRKPATALVTGGLFRYSRNPGYVALTLLYAGIAVAADSLWVFILLIPVLAIMHYAVILREERYLERKFGEDYVRYKRDVRRWI